MPALENLQLGCAVCRIFGYTIWRKLCCKKPVPPRPEFSVICLGLSGSGKSTTLALLSGETLENLEGPTTGFSIKAIQLRDCILNVKEIGGGEKVRPFWKHYYGGAQAIIFMINSADTENNLETARDALYQALSNTALRGLPCLILANCQDLAEARSEAQIKDILELEEACSGRKWVILTSSKERIKELQDSISHFTTFLVGPGNPGGQPDVQNTESSAPNRI